MSLVLERPLLMTIDPETGFTIRCDALQAAAEGCFQDAYAAIGTTDDPGYDRELARRALAPCYRRAQHVVRECGLGVRIGPSPRR